MLYPLSSTLLRKMAPALLTESSRESSPELGIQRPTVYLLDTFSPEAIIHAEKLFTVIPKDSPKHAHWQENARYLLIRSSALSAADIASCPNLKAIGKQGTGIDKIDAKACEARNIRILNTPGVNAHAVAELVLALTMAVARDIPRVAVEQATGARVPKESCSGLILHRKTLGVIGMGNIGRTVAKMFHGAFESPIVAHDPFMPESAWRDIPHIRAKTVDDVLLSSDVVTIHVPLNEETRDLIAYRELSIMKPTAILINASRGGIVNEPDLERALADGLLWGAGLDCHEQEPPSKDRYGALWEQRVVSTPHIGAATAQTQRETAMAAVDALYKYATAS